MPYLIDANVLCESSKPRPDAKVLRWLAEHDADLHVSALTLGEMVKGIHLMDQGKRRAKIEQWFDRIDRWSAGRLLSLDSVTMRRWGAFYAKYQLAGRELNLMDSLVAATALEHQLTLVTRNLGDFPGEVPLFDPWNV